MENLTAGLLTIETASAEDAIRLGWHGRCTDQNPARLLGPYLGQALAFAAERKVPIEMNFKHLEYMNSSSIGQIIHLLRDAHQQEIRLHLIFNPALHWQKIAGESLRALGADHQLLDVRFVQAHPEA